jgi:hypothetical protein
MLWHGALPSCGRKWTLGACHASGARSELFSSAPTLPGVADEVVTPAVDQ